MKTRLRGVIHGKLIELEQDAGLPGGQLVAVTLETLPATTTILNADARESLRRAAGAWSDDPEGLERFLELNRQQRHANRPEITE
jgi:hypothetical protein